MKYPTPTQQIEVIREWWQVVAKDGYNVGQEWLSIEDAVRFMTQCLPRNRRNGCKIYRLWTERQIADLTQFDVIPT